MTPNAMVIVERNEKDTKDEKDTVVATESSVDKDSGTWVTVPKRTKKVRIESHITEPRKKPTNNNAMENEWSSHSFCESD